MSLGGRPPNTFIPPDEYQTNQAKIAAAQKYLEALASQNEAGLRRFEELEAQKRELQRKIEEGEQAKYVPEILLRRSSLADPSVIGVSWSIFRICEQPSLNMTATVNHEHFQAIKYDTRFIGRASTGILSGYG
jgi:hypothetical protein